MTPEEQKHLLIGLGVGIVAMYLWNNKKRPISEIVANPFKTAHAEITTSDYGNPVIIANSGRLNTVVGMRSPGEVTYHDFNQLLANPNNVLANYTPTEVVMEVQRAMDFLNQIGWLTLFENYENQEPVLKTEDPVIFALNLGSGFRLIPHVEQITPSPVVPTTAATT